MAMEKLWESQQLDDNARISLAFGLGKVCQDIKDYGQAIRYLNEGNRLKRASYEYNVAQDEDYFKRLQTAFDDPFFAARHDWGFPDPTPIVIVGMLRSGTTLAEQILASHPQVTGAGERPNLHRLLCRVLPERNITKLPEAAWTIDRETCAKLGRSYVEQLRTYAGAHAVHVTDKMPANFQFLGMLQVILPRARIIHCRRDPIDNCWAIYRQTFSAEQPFAYDLADLGRYYRAYSALMDHWMRVLPGRILDFPYEAVIADQEAATRRLLAFCGLEWDERCLRFHETERVVQTASLSQVRQPVYSSSIGASRHYSPHLQPLIEALERG